MVKLLRGTRCNAGFTYAERGWLQRTSCDSFQDLVVGGVVAQRAPAGRKSE